MPDRTDPLEREALRVYARYQVEIVEACGLCPWAERARLEGRVHPRVVLAAGEEEAHAASLAVIDALAPDETVEVALLIYPRLDLGRPPFDAFFARMRDADARRHPLGAIPFAMAAFHPSAPADTRQPERLIPFLRRTPDPTVQLVRESVLDRVRGRSPQGTEYVDVSALEAFLATAGPPQPPLRERIARTNLATVERMGLEELTRRLEDIRRDRDEAYRALLAPR